MNITRNPVVFVLSAVMLVWFLGSTVVRAESPAIDIPGLKMVSESDMNGHKVLRYEHSSMEEWGYPVPQDDCFYVVPPLKTMAKPPLCVVLHSAGGSGNEALPSICNPHDRGLYGDDTYCVLCLDCAKNKNDWWWGMEEIERNPTLYRALLCPTEKRVLSTVEWAIRTFDIDRNRVYLNGISMGGSGSLGIGVNHGDVFAAVSVVVPAGVKHIEFRTKEQKIPDPPPLFDISSHVDGWSLGQENLLKAFEENQYPIAFAWGTFGHVADVHAAHPAVYEFPWLSIRKNETYPVFTHASTDQHYPGHKNETAPDQQGQINGYFRWKNIEDSEKRLVMELRLVKKEELKRPADIPGESVADITPRRLQQFVVRAGVEYSWFIKNGDQVLQSGHASADAKGLLTVPAARISVTPVRLEITSER